ncbi:S8 family serine peptidase [Halobacillus locisalis]|uniref:S8 family serine peptidase n=1 Tax=Halobacillus locisalis TaxID=220753 RepID=A0A838CV94_9BACI|nr:S8 family serine peptidase [Halobacillus locisalis]MBA2175841.1 S8 family serine peptidase [Halobacillus locisalis]
MKVFCKLSVVLVMVLATFLSFNTNKAQASVLEVDSKLLNLLGDVKDSTQVEAIVTYDALPTEGQLNLLESLGLSLKEFSKLPVVGVKGTALQIESLLNQNLDALSIYPNKDLDYLMKDSRKLIGVESVWADLGYTGEGTTVAVIDSGIDGTHPDLPYGSKVIQNVKLLAGSSIFGQEDLYLENVPNTDTSSGHGTHVAGTIAGLGNASEGLYAGVAPDAKLVGLGAGEGLNILWALEGFNYALEHQEEYGIDVISNSWGTTGEYSPNDPINVASKAAHDNGMTVTFAAGNAGPEDNTLNPYSAAPWVISVAAGTKDKQLADFSSRGIAGDALLHPDVTAPGVDIVATKSSTGLILNTLGAMKDVDYIAPENLPYYTTSSGTSMATPHVSGIIALMEEANPDLSPDQALALLENTAEPMPGYQYHEVGAGYVDAFKAVQQAEQTASVTAE